MRKQGDALRGERTGESDDDGRPAARPTVRWSGRFPPEAAAVGQCRLACEEALQSAGVGGPLVGEALAVLGEIAANAVRHAGTPFTVSVVVEGGVLRVEVFDADPRPPVLRDLDVESTGGRGLHIVSGKARDWGWQPAEVDGVPGKRVWAELE